MTIPDQTQAILLLTTYFTKPSGADPKPLTPTEWGRFAEWLLAAGRSPRELLTGDPGALLATWDDRKVTAERVMALLDRGAAMALALEKWLRAGLWVLTRSDAEYPPRLKQRLHGQAPPVLFGCGNKALLSQGGLAVAGSRKVGNDDLGYCRVLGERAAAAGVSIVSGGARGVDETAMLAALQSEGTAVGVMADSLLRVCTSAKYRAYLAKNDLVLVSSFYPEAGFSPGNAMQRNKYIYCLADAGIAVHSGTSGGTWTGAQEVLKKGWVPLWVRPNDDPDAGNQALLASGARPAPPNARDIDIAALCRPQTPERPHDETPSPAVEPGQAAAITQSVTSGAPEASATAQAPEHDETPPPAPGPADDAVGDLADISFFQLFVAKAQPLCAAEPRTAEQLAEDLGLSKTQVNQWAKQAVAENKLRKLSRPARYSMPNHAQGVLQLD